MGRGGFRQRAGLRVPRCAARGARAARGGRAARLVRDAGPDGGGERAHLRGPPPPSEAQQAARGRALRLPRLTPRAAPAMITTRYTQWDGTQKLKLDADKVFEKLAEYMSYTDDVRQAMDWMMRQGMDFDGVQVMGLEEFIEQLRQEMRQRYRDFNLKNALSEMEQKLQDILNRERSTLDSLKGQKPGIEEKQRELSRLPRRLSEAIRKLESYDFEDAQEGRLRGTARRVREYPRPRKFPRPQSAHVSRAQEPRLPGGARADARDGADEAARAGSDGRQLRHHLARRTARTARTAGDARFPEPQAGDGAAGEFGIRGAQGRAFSALPQGSQANRAARPARHLPESAQGSRRLPRNRPSRHQRDAPGRDQAVLVRRSSQSEPRGHAQEGAGAQGRRSSPARSRRLRDLRKRLREQLIDRALPRHVVVDELGGAVCGGEEGRDGDGDADSLQVPPRLFLDRRLLHPRGRTEAQGPSRGVLEHGRSVHEFAGRPSARLRSPKPPPLAQSAHHRDHRRPADSLLPEQAVVSRMAPVVRRNQHARRPGDAQGSRADHPQGHNDRHVHAGRLAEPARVRGEDDADQSRPRALHPPRPSRRVHAGRLPVQEAKARLSAVFQRAAALASARTGNVQVAPISRTTIRSD